MKKTATITAIIFHFLLGTSVFGYDPYQFTVNQRILVITSVCVRSTPGGDTCNGMQPIGETGVVLSGPVRAQLGGRTYDWYQIDYDNSTLDGWSAALEIPFDDLPTRLRFLGLHRAEVAIVAHQADFHGFGLVAATAIAEAESAMNPSAVGDFDICGVTGPASFGLWQINTSPCAHPEYEPFRQNLLSSPLYSAQAAWAVSNSQTDFHPWSTWFLPGGVDGGGAYKDHVSAARAMFTANPSIASTVITRTNIGVTASANVFVRVTPGGSLVGTGTNPEPAGATGTIIDGATDTTYLVQVGGAGRYYFWWKVQWSDGQVGWSVEDFLDATTSGGCPQPTATTDAATNVTSDSATLNGTVNPNGCSTTVHFEFGTTSSYGTITANQTFNGSTTQDVSAVIGGLSADTTYHFRIVASSSGGDVTGSDMTFRTSGGGCPQPTATTNVATSVTSNSATLNGTVNPNGCSTTVHFEFGTTSSYGSITENQTFNGSTTQGVSAGISGLTAGTTYHFRIVASSSGGTVPGSDVIFTTSTGDCQPTATTNVATNVTSNSATLNGTVNPNGCSTTVYFEYGTTSSYGSITSNQTFSGSTTQSVSAGIVGLSAGTTYHFRIVASSGGGPVTGGDITFTTITTPTPTPSPGCLVANGGFETGDFAGWTLSGDTSFTTVTGTMNHSGNFAAQMGPVNSNGSLTQTINTIPGQSYHVSFWLAVDNGTPNDFSATFAGVNILSLVNSPAFGYTEFSADIVATGTSSDLQFAFMDVPAFWHLDDVCVTGASGTPTPTATATPTGTPISGGALWYNGDFDGTNGLSNERDTSLGSGQFASVYDNFNVTGSGWTVTEVFSNNLENTNITGATWEIRSGTSASFVGTGGTLVASGMTTTPVVTPTGRSGFNFTEFQIKVTGLNLFLPVLPAGQFYWLNVTPTGDLTGRSFHSTTSGANCVGTPCGNDQNAFFNSNFFGVNFGSTADQGQPNDFSMGVKGTVGGGLTPSPTPTATATATATSTPCPSCVQFGNISTRLNVGTGDNAMIGGFIITGTQPKTVIVRGIGPSLPVSGALADPVIEIHGPSGEFVGRNDNWNDALTRQQIIDSGLAPTNNLESALWDVINPGAYTVIVLGNNNGTGVGLFEVYDLDRTVDSKLANISTRGFVGTAENVMIGGTIITGNALTNVLFRAIGPSLINFGVPNALSDPTLELHDGNGAPIASNDNWRSDQEAEILATGIAPTDDRESAILRSLPPGAYTVIVGGSGNATGVALVEAYQLP